MKNKQVNRERERERERERLKHIRKGQNRGILHERNKEIEVENLD